MKGSALGNEYCIYRTPVKLINEGQGRHSCKGGMYTSIQNECDIPVLKHAAGPSNFLARTQKSDA